MTLAIDVMMVAQFPILTPNSRGRQLSVNSPRRIEASTLLISWLARTELKKTDPVVCRPQLTKDWTAAVSAIIPMKRNRRINVRRR